MTKPQKIPKTKLVHSTIVQALATQKQKLNNNLNKIV
jgi:hypothetical protein